MALYLQNDVNMSGVKRLLFRVSDILHVKLKMLGS